jgi:hypothetical protein
MCFLRGTNYTPFLATLLRSRDQPPCNFRVKPSFFYPRYFNPEGGDSIFLRKTGIPHVTTRCRNRRFTAVKNLKPCTHFEAACFELLTPLEWLATRGLISLWLYKENNKLRD